MTVRTGFLETKEKKKQAEKISVCSEGQQECIMKSHQKSHVGKLCYLKLSPYFHTFIKFQTSKNAKWCHFRKLEGKLIKAE